MTDASQPNKAASHDSASVTKRVDVQALMQSDPRFIARLISQLDSQMHGMQDEKKRRQQAIASDAEEVQRIDKEIATHIQPRLVSRKLTLHMQIYEYLVLSCV